MMGQDTAPAAQGTLAQTPQPPRILEFRERLTFGAECEKRFADLRRYMEQGERCFIFDLSRVPNMDSAGVGFLVTCFTTVLRAGGELRLAAPTDRVLYVLLITRLDTVFPVFESVEAALAG